MRFGRFRDGVFARLHASDAELLSAAPWLGGTPTGARRAYSTADLAAPVAPSKIICIGRNYAAHAKELGNEPPKEPLMFFKPPSALIGPGDAIVLPSEFSQQIEHEAEMGVVVATRGRNIRAADALRHVFGYTCVGDITARDMQKKDGQWTRAKGFDTFCPTGPWIETEMVPSESRVTCRVNGKVRQDAPTSDMAFDISTILSYASRVMSLEPGDLIVTGTPGGVGRLVSGDVLEIEVAGVGVLSVRVT